MDYFLTTYSNDYKWPETYDLSDYKKFENQQKMRELQLKDADPHKMGIRKPMEASDVEPGSAVPPKISSPQGETTKYDQPNAYLQKLYKKYPYLHNIMKFTTTDDMAKRVMSEKYKSTYQIEFNKKDDFSTLVDVVKHGEQPQEIHDEAPTPGICSPEGIPAPQCKCAKGLAFLPCQCAKEVPVRRIAWKPAPISKLPQCPREKKKKKKTEEEEGDDQKPKTCGKAMTPFDKVKPFSTEYRDTINTIGEVIIKNKLLHKENIEKAQLIAKRKQK